MAASGSDRAQRDTRVLSDLYEEYYDRVARYIATRIGNLDLAQDLAGEVFLRAVESLGDIERRGVPPQAWLFRVAHNLVVDHYRRSAHRQSVPLDEAVASVDSSDPHGEVQQKLTMQTVYQAMEQLNPAQREVVSLRFMGELSSEETGAIMERTSGAVRELQRTALRALRQLMGTQPQGEGVQALGEHDG